MDILLKDLACFHSLKFEQYETGCISSHTNTKDTFRAMVSSFLIYCTNKKNFFVMGHPTISSHRKGKVHNGLYPGVQLGQKNIDFSLEIH